MRRSLDEFTKQSIMPSDFIQSVSNQILDFCQQERDRVIKQKLSIIRARVLEEGPMDLYECMMGNDLSKNSDVAKMIKDMKEEGYNIELINSAVVPDITMDVVNIDFSKLKIKITKDIMEL